MAKPYTISITDGTGSANVLSGNYNVSATVTGYSSATIDPATIVVDKTTNEYTFTISSTGTLNLHVSEDGTAEGTNVVGATFIRCDSLGNEYGTIITSDDLGIATFNNVPFAADGAPTVYYKQKTSDGEHEYDDTLKSAILTTDSSTLEVVNEPPVLRTIRLTDINYVDLPIDDGSITLN